MYSRKLSVCLLVTLLCFTVTAQQNTSSQTPGTSPAREVKVNGSPEAKPSPSPTHPPEDVGKQKEDVTKLDGEVTKLREDVTKLEALTDGLLAKLWNAIVITSIFAVALLVLLIFVMQQKFVTTQELQTELAPLNTAVAQLKKT